MKICNWVPATLAYLISGVGGNLTAVRHNVGYTDCLQRLSVHHKLIVHPIKKFWIHGYTYAFRQLSTPVGHTFD